MHSHRTKQEKDLRWAVCGGARSSTYTWPGGPDEPAREGDVNDTIKIHNNSRLD